MIWYSFILARLGGLWHKMKGHEVVWVENSGTTCRGDIICNTCNLIIWCRWYDPKWMGGRKE